MLTESDLKLGNKYLYWSPHRQCHIPVIYEGKRRISDMFVFRDPLTLNEFWAYNLINIIKLENDNQQLLQIEVIDNE